LFQSLKSLINNLNIISLLDGTDKRIKVENPVVEMDGDEMTSVIWHKTKETV